jgi:putative nucleotidyltransferase with HDIG domain
MEEKYVFSFELTPGMITSDDVYSIAGHLIAPRNTVLTDELIHLIKQNNILDVRIGGMNDNEPSYIQQLQQSPEYQQFSSEFSDNVTILKDTLNDVISKNEEIDVDALTEQCSHLLVDSGPGLELFNMLHSMKDFNDSTYTHSINVALIAAMLGRWLDYSSEDIDTLMMCGMFHDIGKLTIPEDILNKPGKLTPDEFETIKGHSLNGYNMLKDRNLDTRIKEACLLHHERCDGTGYPYALKSDKIPDFAKIISIADVYDAMTSKRSYHDPHCPFTAIRVMESDAYQKYDPHFISVFLKNVANTYINNTVRLSDGRTGEIVMVTPQRYSRPVVKCGSEFIDLSRNTILEIAALT